MGASLGLVLVITVSWIFRRWSPFRLDRLFRRLQLVAAALYSLGHGGNDAQKTMGIIVGLLIATGRLPKGAEVPLWVVLICHAAIAFGTMFGGWRIVKTMGTKITKLHPFGGFCAETAGAITLFVATLRHPGLHDPHDHGRDHGRGRHAPAVGGQVGRRGPHRLGLGAHDPAVGRGLGPELLPRPQPDLTRSFAADRSAAV
jgi:hypothetical protein